MPGRLSDSINIGVADITFYPANSGMPVYLGLTKEGVTFKNEANWHELTSDQTGKTPLDDVYIGETAEAEVKILDSSKRKISLVMPASSKIGDGNNPEAVTFGQRPGLRASKSFGKLVIHPISAGDSTDYDVIIYRTTNTGGLELAFKLEEEWVIPCKFKAYYDDFRKPGDQLFRIGQDSKNSNEGISAVPKSFQMTPDNADNEAVGKVLKFKAQGTFEDGSNEDLTDKCTWKSDDSSIVSLSGPNDKNEMEATCLALGSSTITAEYATVKQTTIVVVTHTNTNA